MTAGGPVPLLLRLFGRLPLRARHLIVGWTSPAYRVGTVAVIRHDGRILLARHSYRNGWGLPGGMIGWREEPEDTIVREMSEEVSLSVRIVGKPVAMHRREPRRIEYFYDLRLDGCTPQDAHPSSPEIEEVRWFEAADLPRLEKDDSISIDALNEIFSRD